MIENAPLVSLRRPIGVQMFYMDFFKIFRCGVKVSCHNSIGYHKKKGTVCNASHDCFWSV